MRLLSRHNGELSLTPELQTPGSPYAILSHTWGEDDEEVTYEDVCDGKSIQHKAGYKKIEFALETALTHGLSHIWVDTCCIDKRDRNELGEAINRMFEWYANAEVCFVYLSDVKQQDWRTTIQRSRWFTRGWTLQELLAPKELSFYSCEGNVLGSRSELAREIFAATEIDVRTSLKQVDFSQRFRWSLNRTTKKPEDLSYCLVGLLEVSLIFNYGEGAPNAQQRLLEEVEKEHGRRTVKEIRKAMEDWHFVKSNKLVMNAVALMDSLEFDTMHLRQNAIKNPYSRTCGWLLQHRDYQRWLEGRHERFIWIKGKPGAGKSTLMKFAESESPRESNCIRCSFYFNARGSSLEKSTVGMYRSLLLQLLEGHQESLIQSQLAKQITKQMTQVKAKWTWTKPRLETALQFVAQRLKRKAQVFIDALDECEVLEVQEMVDFFQDLTSHDVPLSICFASRYYPTVSIRRSIELLLEKQGAHAQDLIDFIDGRLDVRDDVPGRALRSQVIDKANGVFFWAILVVPLLNTELSSGSIFNVRKRLNDLPSELSDLLREIIGRDSADLHRFRLCLHLLLFAQRPLAVHEYYFAMVTSLAIDGMADHAEYKERWDKDFLPVSTMEKFVSSSSRGLAEVTRPDSFDTYGVVQVIHESVRDFLLKHNGLMELHPHIGGDLTSWIHDRLKQICQAYMSVEVQAVSHDQWTSPLAVQRQVIRDSHQAFPLFHYAHESVVFHAEEAAAHLPQDGFLLSFDFDRLRDRLSHAAHKVRDTRWKTMEYASQYGPVHILVIFDAGRLIKAAHSLGFDINGSEDSLSPLVTAVWHDSLEAVRSLLACGVSTERRSRQGKTALLASVMLSGEHVSACKLLLDHFADVWATDEHGQRALLIASNLDKPKYVSLLRDYSMVLNDGKNETGSRNETTPSWDHWCDCHRK